MTEELPPEYEAPLDVEALGWEAPEPPKGFASRVVDAMADEVVEERRSESERKLRPLWIAGVVGVAAAALLWVISAWPEPATVSDSMLADAIETVDIHDRAIAVAQPGSSLRWQVDGDGAARVRQDAGRVFYRVEEGGPFEVKTPAGTVTVTGTCFEVEMKTMKSKQGIKAGALGAALASAVFVTVYEGQVVLANDKGDVTLDAGQRGSSTADRGPSRWDDDDSSKLADSAGGQAASAPSGTDPIAAVRMQGQALERLRAQKLAQTEEIEALRAQVESLGGTPTGLGPEAKKQRAKKCAQASRNSDCPFLDPDQDTLEEMARCATVKYDYPSFLDDIDPPQSEGYARKLGLEDPAELEAFQAAAEKHHEQFNSELRELYVELGGDPQMAEDSSANALQGFIEDQLDRELVTEIQRKVAEERAGLREPPAPGAELPLEERFWRMRAEMGNEFERHIAEALGPQRAHDLRQVGDGWPGSTSVHSSDCR